jgi:hypothetical protein
MTRESRMGEPAPRSGRHARADTPRYRWWLLLVTSLGALLASLTSGTLVIALPEILRDLHTDLFALLSGKRPSPGRTSWRT